MLRAFSRTGGWWPSRPRRRSASSSCATWPRPSSRPASAYPEKEVNQRLGNLHSDVASLRRYLVDLHFMSRSARRLSPGARDRLARRSGSGAVRRAAGPDRRRTRRRPRARSSRNRRPCRRYSTLTRSSSALTKTKKLWPSSSMRATASSSNMGSRAKRLTLTTRRDPSGPVEGGGLSRRTGPMARRGDPALGGVPSGRPHAARGGR